MLWLPCTRHWKMIRAMAGGILNSVLEFLAPRHCVVCGKRLMADEKSVCSSCLLDLNLSEYASGSEGNGLERTFWQRLPIVRAAAFMTYDRQEGQHAVVLDLKYHNNPEIGNHLGKLMSLELKERGFFSGVDVIIPMPIPTAKRVWRGYNQSEQLARGISQATGLPVDIGAIRRRPYKTSQTRLTAVERTANVKDSFYLSRGAADRLKGRHLLLVDDVITTTSTVQECGRTLCQIPDIRISVLSLAVSKKLINNIRNANPAE